MLLLCWMIQCNTVIGWNVQLPLVTVINKLLSLDSCIDSTVVSTPLDLNVN